MKKTLFLSVIAAAILTGCSAADVELFSDSFPTPRQDEYIQKLCELGEPLNIALPVEDAVQTPKGKGNAAEFYSEAFKIYNQEKDASGFIPTASKAVDLVVSGTDVEKCEFVPTYFASADKPENVMPVTPSYVLASAMLGRADEAENKGELAAAEDLYKRIIIFGRHIESEQASLNQIMTGLQIEGLGAKELFAFYTERQMADKAPAAEKLLLAVLDKYEKTRQKLHLLTNVKKFACLKACIQTVETDPSPVWRKEACTTLAVLRICGFRGPKDSDDRYIAPIQLYSPAMQALASKYLKKAALADKDETVKSWASWCMMNVDAETILSVEDIFQAPTPEE